MWFGETKRTSFLYLKTLFLFIVEKDVIHQPYIHIYSFSSFLFKWGKLSYSIQGQPRHLFSGSQFIWSLDKLFLFHFFPLQGNLKLFVLLRCHTAGIRDLKYSARHQTHAPCIGSMRSHAELQEVTQLYLLIPFLLLSHFLPNPLHSFCYYRYVSEILVIKVSNT